MGPRQAGKTTLMRLLEEELQSQGETTVFLNLDIERDRQFFVSQEDLLRKIELEAGREKAYIFIDEIQRKENAGLFLKGIYDRETPHKLIVSGSGSLELKEKIHESLAGRKRIFRLDTLSFRELVNYRTDYRYEEKLGEFLRVNQGEAQQLLEEYFNYGGYPRVVLAEQLEEKRRLIDEIYQSYLERDIGILLNIQKPEAFSNLVQMIASQVGQLVNHAELASTLDISYPTVREYLWYLEKTFVLNKITPFFRNKRKEISKSPVYYFTDLGLRNYAAGNFGNATAQPAEAGFLFQNALQQVLESKFKFTPKRTHYWRTQSGAEVDFVIRGPRKVVPIEAKYKALKQLNASRSLLSFIRKYTPDTAYLVNLALTGSRMIEGTQLRGLTFFDFLETEF